MAKELGVTRQCLFAWNKKGKLEFVKTPGGSNYVTQETYDSLLNMTKNNLEKNGESN